MKNAKLFIASLIAFWLIASCKKDNSPSPTSFENTKWHNTSLREVDSEGTYSGYYPVGDTTNFDKNDYFIWKSDNTYLVSSINVSGSFIDSGYWKYLNDSTVFMTNNSNPNRNFFSQGFKVVQLTSNRLVVAAPGVVESSIAYYNFVKAD